MIGTSRGWLAAMAFGVALAFGAGSAFAAGQPGVAEHDGIGKKKDAELDKDTMSQSKGLDGIKAPEIKTGDEHKKP